MTIKYYTSVSLFKSFSVKRKNGHEYRVVFAHNNTHRKGEFITEDTELQELIEKRPEFRTGEIKLINTVVEKEDAIVEHVDVIPKPIAAPDIERIPVEEVKNINEAKEYLRSKGVHHMKLKSPDAIKAEAEKLNIKFPNVKL